jgi:hypothetical protein
LNIERGERERERDSLRIHSGKRKLLYVGRRGKFLRESAV